MFSTRNFRQKDRKDIPAEKLYLRNIIARTKVCDTVNNQIQVLGK